MPHYGTHFETLGVVPSSTQLEIATAYRDQILKLLPEEFIYKGSLYFHPVVLRMRELNEAFAILCNGDKRARYLKRLQASCMICPLCDGKGRIDPHNHLVGPPCFACQHTGWAA